MTANERDRHDAGAEQTTVLPETAAQLVELERLQQSLADSEERAKSHWEQYLRAVAELDNVRKRAQRDIESANRYGLEKLAAELLPVKDSLEAAIAMPDAPVAQVLEGVHATLRQLSAALERNKVLPISPPAGTKFDPHQHQAISVVPAEQEPNTVVAVLQKGYLIADRVLRPALVTVSAPK